MADIRPIAIDDADSIIRSFHLGLQDGTIDPNKPIEAIVA